MKFFRIIIATVAMATLSLIVGSTANAMTPVDSCFTMTGSVIVGFNKSDSTCSPATPTDLVFPTTINGVAVTGINGYGLFASSNFSTITIPEGHLELHGRSLFSGMSNLTTVTLPDSLTTIGDLDGNPDGVFANNAKLSNVTFGKNVKTISDGAFSNDKLSTISLPDSVVSIGMVAFASQQVSVGTPITLSLGSKIETIGSGAFQNLQTPSYGGSITSDITIPASVKTVGLYSFAGFTGHLTIASGAQTFDKNVFTYSFVKSVTIDGKVGDDFTSANAEIFYRVGVNPVTGDTLGARYVPVYTKDPSNPYGYTSTAYPGDGGGYIVNPATVTVKYVDENGKEVAPSTIVDAISSDPSITSYLVSQNTAGDMTKYYTAGYSYTAQPVEVTGYITPSAKTVVLQPRSNVITLVYKSASTSSDTSSNTSANEGETPKNSSLAHTGYNIFAWLGGALGLVVLPAIYLCVRAKRKNTKIRL